jgi:hypothetical protein
LHVVRGERSEVADAQTAERVPNEYERATDIRTFE